MKLVFATNNAHKLKEIQHLLGDSFQLKTLKEIGCTEEIPETTNSIEGNASQKANYVFKKFKVNCFADDTGLEIQALGGEPGVHSAHYAGPERDNEKNIALVLEKLKEKSNKNARFKTIISLVIKGKEKLFEGIVKGKIIDTRKGSNGFGYDSIFVPDGYSHTFAEMSEAEKNAISHRALAFQKLIDFLKSEAI